MVLFYDSKFARLHGEFYMYWFGSYQVKYVTSGGVAQLSKLNGEIFTNLVNGSRLKLY